MGFAPFKIERKGPLVEIRHLKIYNAVSMLLYAFFICFLLGTNVVKRDYSRPQSPMQRFINFLYILLVAGLMSVNVIFNKVSSM